MKHRAVGGIVVSLFFLSVAAADSTSEHTKIPLDQIWAWRIPGTKDVGALDASKTNGVTEHPILHDVFGGLGLLPKGEKAAPAFVVEGEGKAALLNATAVFKKDQSRMEILPANTELSLVFYSHSIAMQVELVSVEKATNLVLVKYRFLKHGLAVNRIYFALIPIGEFAPGTVHVKIEQQDATDLAGNRSQPVQDAERLISGNLNFEVRE